MNRLNDIALVAQVVVLHNTKAFDQWFASTSHLSGASSCTRRVATSH